MNFKIFFLALFCFLGRFSFAQTMEGSIKSQSGEGIALANIRVLNTSIGTTADRDGHFILTLSAGNYQLAVSAVGFASQTGTVVVAEGRATQADFILQENTAQLSEVIVSADKVEAQLQKTPLAVTALTGFGAFPI